MTRFLSILFLLLTSSVLYAQSPQDAERIRKAQQVQSSLAQLDQAQKTMKTLETIKQLEKTEALLKAQKAADLQRAETFFKEGKNEFQKKRLAEAERNIQRAIELNPQNPDYYFELANVYAVYFDQTKAKGGFGAPSAEQQAKMSRMLNAGRRALEQTIMLAPVSVPAHYNLGVIYKRQGDYEKARERFRKVVDLDPNQVNAYLQVAATYEGQGFFDEAEDAYRQALEIDYANAGIRTAIEDLKERREIYRERIERDPSRSLLGRPFQHSPGSHAAGLRAQDNRSGNLQAALPFLSYWLAQEFMKRRDNFS